MVRDPCERYRLVPFFVFFFFEKGLDAALKLNAGNGRGNDDVEYQKRGADGIIAAQQQDGGQQYPSE
jgi:hypothetical protein